MTDDKRRLEALLRDDFRAFLEKCFYTLDPGQVFVRSWAIEAIAWKLELVRRGKIRRLIINMPPRSLKSTMASVAFPAFFLGHENTLRISASVTRPISRRSTQTTSALSWNRLGTEDCFQP